MANVTPLAFITKKNNDLELCLVQKETKCDFTVNESSELRFSQNYQEIFTI